MPVATRTEYISPLKITSLAKLQTLIRTAFGAMAAIGGQRHWGIDLSAGEGTPIYAPADARVERVYNEEAGGNVLILQNGSVENVFAHLSRYAVREGQAVKQGQVVGYTGSTGKVTGPHLHWEVKINGKPIDPLDLFDPTSDFSSSAYQFASDVADDLRKALEKVLTDVPGATILDAKQGTLAIPDSFSGCPPGTEPTVLPSIGNPEGTHVCFIRQGPFGVKIEPLDALVDFTGNLGDFLFGGGLVQFLINLLVLMAGGALVLIGGRMVWSAA